MIFPMLESAKTTQRDLDLTRAAFYFPTVVWVLKIDFALKSHTHQMQLFFAFLAAFGAWDFGSELAISNLYGSKQSIMFSCVLISYDSFTLIINDGNEGH